MQDNASGAFIAKHREEWGYNDDKVRHTIIQLPSGKKHTQTSWHEEGLRVKEKLRGEQKNGTRQFTYVNGLLQLEHSRGKDNTGAYDVKWMYEYEYAYLTSRQPDQCFIRIEIRCYTSPCFAQLIAY